MTDRLCYIQCCMLGHHSNKPSCSVTSANYVPVRTSFQRLFTWNLSQLLALSSVYRTASGTRLGKTSAIGGQQPDALVSPCRLCELVGRRDLSLSLSSFPAPQPLSPSWHVPGWADSLIHGTITSYFPQYGKWVHQQSGHHSKSNKIW